MALRELMAALAGDVEYQHKLRRDFCRRRIHPSVEALVWAYAIGKPMEYVEVSGGLDVNQRLEQQRALINSLDLDVLEVLAAESQAMMDRATALAQARLVTGKVIDPVPRG